MYLCYQAVRKKGYNRDTNHAKLTKKSPTFQPGSDWLDYFKSNLYLHHKLLAQHDCQQGFCQREFDQILFYNLRQLEEDET